MRSLQLASIVQSGSDLVGLGGGGVTPHRYWRFTILDYPSPLYLSIAEVKLSSAIGGAQTAFGGTVTAGAERAAFPAIEAFDDILVGGNNAWGIELAVDTDIADYWVQYDYGLGNDIAIVEFTVTSRADGGNGKKHSPNSFKLQYSDDGTTWTDSITVLNEPEWGSGESRSYSADKDSIVVGTAETHWRVYVFISENPSYLGMAELEMRTVAAGADVTDTSYAISGAHSGSNVDTRAFDNNTALFWNMLATATPQGQSYIGQAFPSAQDIVEIAITSRSDAFWNQTPQSFYVEKSADGGTTWETVWVVTGEPVWTAGETRVFTKP